MENIFIRAPIALKNSLRDMSQQRGQTLNGLILEILWRYVEAMERDVTRP